MIFVKGPLETLNYFVDCMIDGLSDDSYFTFDICEPDVNGLLNFIKQKHPQRVITFNNIAIDISTDGRNFWELFQLKVFNYLVDHPINYLPRLLNVPDCIVPIVVDWNHKRFLETYCPHLHTLFLPHGGTEYNAPYKTFSQRSIDVLYVGSNQKMVTEFHAIPELPENGMQLYAHTYQLFLYDPSYTPEAAVEDYFLKIGYRPTDRLFLTCLEWVYCSMECNARCYYKTEIMTQVAKSGFSMEIYGDDWDFLSTYSNVHIHPRISSEECIRLMTDAKIVMNFMPWFKDGSHERIYNAMLNGAVCLTDPTPFLEEYHKELDTIAYFHLNDFKEAADKIDLLLSHPDLWEGISHRARAVSQKDTWRFRREILQNPAFDAAQ